MSLLLEAVLVPAVYIAGCLTGHRVVTAVEAYVAAVEAKIHTKLDALIAKTKNSVHPLSKG